MTDKLNLYSYVPVNACLSPVMFDENQKLFTTVQDGLLKIAKYRWQAINRMFADFAIKEFVLFGDAISYVYNNQTEVAIGLVAELPFEATKYLKQINFALVGAELPYRFIRRNIHCYVLDQIPPETPCYSLSKEDWIFCPKKQDYSFASQELCAAFDDYMHNVADFVKNQPTNKNGLLTPVGIKNTEEFIAQLEERALACKANSLEHEYNLEYLLWRTFGDIGQLKKLQDLVVASYNYNISELNQC